MVWNTARAPPASRCPGSKATAPATALLRACSTAPGPMLPGCSPTLQSWALHQLLLYSWGCLAESLQGGLWALWADHRDRLRMAVVWALLSWLATQGLTVSLTMFAGPLGHSREKSAVSPAVQTSS